MKQNIIFLMMPVFFCLQACKTKTVKDHIAPATMDSLLLDIHAAEAYCTMVKKDSLSKTETKNMDSLAQYYTDIFAHYHINKEIFDNSLEWYKAHPAELDSIYTNMLPEISKLDIIYKAKK